MTSEIYIFSGLGADERVFQKLDFSDFKTTFVKWIIPQDNETIENYSSRLLEQITTKKPTLIGLSFGGIIAVEVAKSLFGFRLLDYKRQIFFYTSLFFITIKAIMIQKNALSKRKFARFPLKSEIRTSSKQIETEKVILIASAKTKNEIPFYFRYAGQLGLHKLVPTKLLKSSNFITNWFFGTNSTFDKKLLKQILIDTNPIFLKWAIEKVARWTNQTKTKNIIHIHGTSDRILPLKFVNCDLIVKDGGHLMTLNKPNELNNILRHQI